MTLKTLVIFCWFFFPTFVVIEIPLAILFYLAFSLKCWQCNSVQNPLCGYPFEEKNLNQSMLVECPGTEAVCLKVARKCNFVLTTKRENINICFDFIHHFWKFSSIIYEPSKTRMKKKKYLKIEKKICYSKKKIEYFIRKLQKLGEKTNKFLSFASHDWWLINMCILRWYWLIHYYSPISFSERISFQSVFDQLNFFHDDFFFL